MPLDTAAGPSTLPKRSGRMTLDAVVKGRLDRPIRVLVYGIEGVGKSTFASGAPAPIFLCAEDGTSELDVARLPEPHTWAEALEALAMLTTDAHSYQTLVVDTLDWLEPLCWDHVCATKKLADIEEPGFSAGYKVALDHWRVYVKALERLRDVRHMNIVSLAHSSVRTFKNPEGDDFDRYETKLQKFAGGLLREWHDAVLFAAYETYTHKANKKALIAKGIQTGARVLYTQERAAWKAKNRYGLPEMLPLEWADFAAAMKAHKPEEPDALRARVDTLLAGSSDDTLKVRVTKAVAAAGDDATTLARIVNRLTVEVSRKQPPETTEEST